MIKTIADVGRMSVNGILGSSVSYYNIAQVHTLGWLGNVQTGIGIIVGIVTLIFLYYRIIKLKMDIKERRK